MNTPEQKEAEYRRLLAAHSANDQASWLQRMAWIPIPLFLVAIALLWAADLRTPYESPYLMMALNFVFLTLGSLFIASLVSRSFLARGTPGLLMLGCGVVFWGAAGLVGAATGLLGAGGHNFVNITETIHNICVWLSALFQLAGAVLLYRSSRAIRAAGLWLVAAFMAVLGAIVMVILSTLAGWTPVFFVQGQGGTPLRQVILSLAIVMFVLTAILLREENRRSSSPFTYWYALGLVMWAAGLFGVMVEPTLGSILSWTGRSAQLLGGAYMLIAAIASVRESHIWGIPLEDALRESRLHNEFLANVIELAAQPFAVGYPDGHLGLINKAFEQLTGYSSEELRSIDWAKTLTPPEWREIEQKKLEELHRTSQPVRYEKEYVRKDGSRVPIELLVHLFKDPDGKPRYYYSFITDITQRKQAEEALQDERDFIAGILSTAGALVIVLDREGRIIRFNRACEQITGYTSDEVKGRLFWDLFILPEECQAVKDTFAELRKGQFPNEHENYWVARDGNRRLTHWTNTVLIDSSGTVEYVIGTGIDITDRRQAEDELRQAHELLETITKGTGVIIAAQDTNFRYTYFNKAYQEEIRRLTGKDIRIGMSMVEVFAHVPEQQKIAMEEWSRVLKGETVNKTIEFGDPGRYRRVYNVLQTPILDAGGNVLGAGEVAYDVTRQVKAEEALRESEQRYRGLFESMQEGFFLAELVFDDKGIPVDWRFVDVNPAHRRIIGLRREEVIGRTVRELFPGLEDFWFEAHTRVALTGVPESIEGFVRDTGHYYMNYLYSPRRGQFACIFTDITERKQAEEELSRHKATLEEIVKERTRELEERYTELRDEISERKKAEDALRIASAYNRSLIDSSLDPLVTIDANGRITDVNKATEKVTGQTRVELIGTDFSDYFTEPDKARAGYKQVFSEGSVQDYPLEILHCDGHITPVLYNASVYHDRTGKVLGVFAAARDITELRRAEEEKKRLENQLIQAQKMEALGRFAGGIAHDLNNILYPIIIDIESLLEETVLDTSMHQTLNQVLKAANRQKDLIKQILSFSRRSEQRLSPMKVTPLVTETIDLLRSSLPSTIKIKKHIDSPCDIILGNPIQVQQVIMNLFRNAADALESQTGTIEVSLTNTFLEQNPAQPELKAGQYLQLTVKDTGQGMTSKVMSQIFEPFFTTKDAGKGSGMGLAVVHGIIKSLGGGIIVESEPGKGSQFTTYLPLTDEKFPMQSPSADKSDSAKEKGKILLIDDEDIILTSIQNALKRIGYDVVAVKDSLEAVKLFSRAPSEFDLVITDLTMPQMTGMELADKLMNIRSEIPIILCTGFNDAINEEQVKACGIRGLLLKPASTNELKTAISQALEG